MVSRTIEGPGDGLYVSGETAARWLGISEDTFHRLVEQQDSWFQPRRIGRSVLYHWMDVVALSRMICGAKTVEGKPSPEKKSRPPETA